MIDSHCHLDAAEFDPDRAAVQAAAQQAGVRQIVVPGVAVNAFARQKKIVADWPGAVAAYGIHPLYVMQADDGDLRQVHDWLANEPAVAVGEIGLDHYIPDIDPARQLAFFRQQLRLARDFDLPVILHVRAAIDPVLAELRRIRVRGGIAHAFNGSRQQADNFLQLGFKLGYGGAMTYPGSRRIRHMAASLPDEAIVLETDAPDIPPVWLNRGRNSPAELPHIAAVLAELRQQPLADVVTLTSANARAVLPGLTRSTAEMP
jgi:TatD DNase family protein